MKHAIVKGREVKQPEVVGPVDSKIMRLEAVNADLLEACKTFIKYADNDKHPHLKSYSNTLAGVRMREAIAKAEGRE